MCWDLCRSQLFQCQVSFIRERMKLISKLNLSPSNSCHSYTVWLLPPLLCSVFSARGKSFEIHSAMRYCPPFILCEFQNGLFITEMKLLGAIEFSNRLPSASSQTCLDKSNLLHFNLVLRDYDFFYDFLYVFVLYLYLIWWKEW